MGVAPKTKAILLQWDSYEELQTGVLLHSAFPVCMWFHNYFPSLLIGHQGQWRTQEFFSGGGSTNSVEDRGQRGRGSGGGSLLVRGSGGSCNLVQEISFHIVKFS